MNLEQIEASLRELEDRQEALMFMLMGTMVRRVEKKHIRYREKKMQKKRDQIQRIKSEQPKWLRCVRALPILCEDILEMVT